ncbi:MAG TPA: glycosyltransferase family 39 protein [Chitinophagaceae bacterium]|nr:glycosyltransferase family 39 protein [Chitinophagaceae bacterium]
MKSWIEKNRNLLYISGLIILYILSVLINLGHLNLRVEEPRRAIVSLEMLERGEFFDSHTMGWSYYNKPPLFNWILSGLMKITGSDSEFICRIPSVISLLLLGLSNFLFTRKYLGERLAALSSFFVMTCADMYFYWLSNGAEIDIFYSLIVYLQVITVFKFYEQKKFAWLFISSWFFCAIGFFTKGYTSLIFQGLTLLALCVYARSLKILFRPQHLFGILAFLLVSGSFLYFYSFSNSPRVLLINLLNESLLKSAVGQESHGKFYKIFSYPLVLIRVLAPWCFILLFLIKRKTFKLFDNPLIRFSIFFILFNIPVYWLTGAQKTRYIIMFIPFVMSIVVYLIKQVEEQLPALFDKIFRYAGILFVFVLASIIMLPFFAKVEWGYSLLFSGFLLFFLILYYRSRQYRIWLFLTGVIFVRLIYASIGIPLKKQKEFDYHEMAMRLAEKNNFHEIRFWAKSEKLPLDIVCIDTIYKWKDKPVYVIPGLVSYQVPYYFYKATGVLMKYDTTIYPGKTYVSYRPYLGGTNFKEIASYYDKQFGDSLILFRSIEE